MDEIELLKSMKRVKAPPDFESQVGGMLIERKIKRKRIRTLGLSLAGAAGTIILAFLIISVLIIPHQPLTDQADAKKADIPFDPEVRYSGERVFPITEQVTYNGEFRRERQKTPTIYILEQVSDSPGTPVKY